MSTCVYNNCYVTVLENQNIYKYKAIDSNTFDKSYYSFLCLLAVCIILVWNVKIKEIEHIFFKLHSINDKIFSDYIGQIL